MKKVLAMIFVLAMLVSSVAMAETIVVMPKLVGIPYFNASEVGVKAAGEELGIDARYTGPTEGDAALQVQMIEDLLVDGIDALAIAPNDPDSVSPVLQKCIADNVLVLDWDTTANGDDVTYSVHQIDDKVLGETLIDLLVDKMGEEGEYAIVTGYLTAANLNTWIKYGQDYAAEKYPGLKLVTDPVASDESQQEAYNQALALIQAYPDLKGILGYSTPAPIGIAKAVQEKGLNEQIAVVGTSMPNDSNEYLKDGSLDYAVLWDPAQLSNLAVYVAHLQLAGETL
jgi:simple sugar transport system substrate-binding protein/rhamnose transport system substrate-binding protein